MGVKKKETQPVAKLQNPFEKKNEEKKIEVKNEESVKVLEKKIEDRDIQFVRLMRKDAIPVFEKWAKNNGAVEVSIGASTEAYGTGYKKFLKRQGYRDVGFLAVKG